MHRLPTVGLGRDEIFERIERMRSRDVRWRDGRAFTLAYHAGDDVLAVAEEAYRRLSTENGLNTDAFPSLRELQRDVVAVVAGWCGGDEQTSGFLTSGGTESILLAVRAARERARRDGRAGPWNMVLPTSAHAAFEKAADYFGIESHRVDVGPDWRADASAMRAACDTGTILVVGSAPQYPQGVVDPIPALGALALEHDANCHVDACMGGVTLTFLERLGHDVAPWHFAVPGVTSISIDLHKYGYTAKGAGVLLHRTRRLRDDQTFVTERWLGGVYGSSGILGTKSGGSWAAAWAVMHHLGEDGYRRLTAAAHRTCLRLAAEIERRPGLQVVAPPDTTLLAFRSSDTDDAAQIDIAALGAALWRRGWYLDRQGPPLSLHCTVNAVHEAHLDEFLVDLDAALTECVGDEAGDGSTQYGTIE